MHMLGMLNDLIFAKSKSFFLLSNIENRKKNRFKSKNRIFFLI